MNLMKHFTTSVKQINYVISFSFQIDGMMDYIGVVGNLSYSQQLLIEII